jgi:hypothetical protein
MAMRLGLAITLLGLAITLPERAIMRREAASRATTRIRLGIEMVCWIGLRLRFIIL